MAPSMLVAGVVLVVIALAMVSMALALAGAGGALITGGIAVAIVQDRDAKRSTGVRP